MFLKTDLDYLSQIALKSMQLLVLINQFKIYAVCIRWRMSEKIQ